jgi:hypothetical protein
MGINKIEVYAGVITLRMKRLLLIKCEGRCWQHRNDEEDVVSWRKKCLDLASKDIANEKTLLTSY